MDITKAKEFLERQGLDDCHYQDSGMIEHIAEQMEMYHAEQLRLGGVVGRSEQLTCECVEIGSTECNKINDKWICCKCNRPLAG